MKILFITTRRTGGSNFAKWISIQKNLEYVYEPDVMSDFIKDNTIVKIIYFPELEERIVKLSKSFDKIIIHRRLDVIKQTESVIYSMVNHVFRENYTVKKSFFDDNRKLYNEWIELYKKSNNNLDLLNFGFHTKYEEIFSDNYNWSGLLNYLEIDKPKNLYFLNYSQKYRLPEKKII